MILSAWRTGEFLRENGENFSPNSFSRSGKVSKSEMMRVLLKLDRIEENEDDEVSTDEDDDDTVDGGSASKHRAVGSSDLNHYRHTCSFLDYLDERVFWCLGQKLMLSAFSRLPGRPLQHGFLPYLRVDSKHRQRDSEQCRKRK